MSLRLVPESVQGLRLLKRGYAAQYDYAKAFVVKEESPQTATAVMEKLRGRIGQTQPVHRRLHQRGGGDGPAGAGRGAGGTSCRPLNFSRSCYVNPFGGAA